MAQPGQWAIEFRNGSFFQTLQAESGGPKITAMGFPSQKAAEVYMDQNPWILFNGGMPVKI